MSFRWDRTPPFWFYCSILVYLDTTLFLFMTSWLSQISYIAETNFWNIMSSSTPQQQPQANAASGGGDGAPPPEQVAQAVEAAKAAARFQDAADALKKQASLATDPAEREKLWRAAYLKEKEAHGESRKARCTFLG